MFTIKFFENTKLNKSDIKAINKAIQGAKNNFVKNCKK